MRDFSELDSSSRGNESTRRALLDFSFHLALGNLDEAFSKVRKVKRYVLACVADGRFSDVLIRELVLP